VKVIKPASAKTWSAERACYTCEAVLEVEHSDLKMQPDQLDGWSFECPECGQTCFVSCDDGPSVGQIRVANAIASRDRRPQPRETRPPIDDVEQWTLGQLIDALEKRDAADEVWFDFVDMVPGKVDSYRGYYEQLAIAPQKRDWNARVTVASFLAVLRSALSTTFHGYRGGEYTMHRHTPLWVAERGDSHSTAVVGVVGEGHVVIETRYLP
jgi:hypothetical protein